jgi:NAD(P)-dependent dehydrogenase (short-subunit alcohol dehydrogenase family)
MASEEAPARRVAVVTGASRGIGRQLCLDLASAGWDVVCVARSSADRPSKLPGTVDETAEAVRARGGRALAVGLDVRDAEGVAALADGVEAELGRCDLLVNNAAVAPPRPALEDGVLRWLLSVDVNLNAPFYFIHAFRALLEASAGRVVNVSSAASVFPQFGRAAYTATKRGLEGLTEALAHDLRGRVAVDCLRIDLLVYSEGFAFTTGGAHADHEDPVIVSDAVLWLAGLPLAHTGHIHDLTALREQGVVRPKTRHRGDAAGSG